MDLSWLDDASFDVVCIFQALHHLTDPEAFLAEVRRVLREDGVLLVSDPNGTHPLRSLASKVGRLVGHLSEDEHALGMNEVARQLQRVGFSLGTVHTMNLLSELNFLMAAVASLRFRWLGELMLLANYVLRPIDDALEASVFPRWPNLGWRFLVVAHKGVP